MVTDNYFLIGCDARYLSVLLVD